MHSIYRGAILTVAAASGPDGCFAKADFVSQGIEFQTGHRRNWVVHMRENLPHHGKKGNYERMDGGTVELLSRGWVLQERILSRRFLLFTPREVIWECWGASDCECGRTKKDASLRPDKGFELDLAAPSELGDLSNHPKVTLTTILRNWQGEDRRRSLRRWWRRLMRMHASLMLTKESDRLTSILGLASYLAIEDDLGDYIAGHFSSGLPLELAWYTTTLYRQLETFVDLEAANIPSWYMARCSAGMKITNEFPDDLRVFPILISHDSSSKLTIRCSVFRYLKPLPKNEHRLRTSYYPDREWNVADLTGDIRYILLARHDSTTENETVFGFIQVQVLDMTRLQVRRLGFLELWHESVSETTSMALIESCFGLRNELEVELF